MAERGSGGSRQSKARRGKTGGDEPLEAIVGDHVRTGLIQGQTFAAKPVQYTVRDGLALFEGDIVLGTEEEMELQTEQLRDVASGAVASAVMISGAQFRWPNCRIPFTIDGGLANPGRVNDAIAHWQANTDFRFVARTTETDFVTFRTGTGCSSAIGRRGGQQFVNLGTGCTVGNVIHEIGHVVGLWHEQSREDRDAFVTIHWDKIQAGTEHNFNQHITDGDDVGAYDYGSIMHYPRDAFSVDGSDTITPVDPAAAIGQRTALSPGDIAAANSVCPRAPKLPLKDVKEPLSDVKPPRMDGPVVGTLKERVKDLRLDTRKEQLSDTIKERVKDVFRDPIKRPGLDPPLEKFRDPLRLPGPLTGPQGGGLGGRLPFTVATPHVAPGAGADPAGEVQATVAHLDAQLEALAAELELVDGQREALQQQYDQVHAALQQALDAADQA